MGCRHVSSAKQCGEAVTKPYLQLDDNRGLCESCNSPSTLYESQSGYPVLLGGGLGMGKMWMCRKCLKAAKQRELNRINANAMTNTPGEKP